MEERNSEGWGRKGREGLGVMRKGGKGFRAWEPSVAQDTKYS